MSPVVLPVLHVGVAPVPSEQVGCASPPDWQLLIAWLPIVQGITLLPPLHDMLAPAPGLHPSEALDPWLHGAARTMLVSRSNSRGVCHFIVGDLQVELCVAAENPLIIHKRSDTKI